MCGKIGFNTKLQAYLKLKLYPSNCFLHQREKKYTAILNTTKNN